MRRSRGSDDGSSSATTAAAASTISPAKKTRKIIQTCADCHRTSESKNLCPCHECWLEQALLSTKTQPQLQGTYSWVETGVDIDSNLWLAAQHFFIWFLYMYVCIDHVDCLVSKIQSKSTLTCWDSSGSSQNQTCASWCQADGDGYRWSHFRAVLFQALRHPGTQSTS